MVNVILYTMYFIIGTLLGSFFTLAVYRIPLKQDITHKRSYCPKCNHKLEFFDLIPVLSYIFLGGKCRYCKNKIRPRYLILELISGLTFMIYAISCNINILNISIEKIIEVVFGYMFISILIIIGGIDQEKHNINKSVLTFGLIIEVIHIIYLCILRINIYRYIIYLLFAIIILIISKEKYFLQILALCFYIVASGIEEEITIFSIIITLLCIAIKSIIIKLRKKDSKISIGLYLTFSNIAVVIIQNLILLG